MTHRARRTLLAASIALLLGNLIAQAGRGIWNIAAGGAPDFVGFAAAARLLAHGSRCLYCALPLAQAAAQYVGHTGPVPAVDPFLNPPPAALVLVPLVALPKLWGFAIFIALSAASLVAAGWLLIRRLSCPPMPTLLALAAIPSGLALVDGQWAPLLTLALVASLCLVRRRPMAAGMLLALLLIKPQTIWLVPLALIAARRWRVLSGLCLGAVAGAALSVALVGVHETLAWASAVEGAGSVWLAGSSSVPGFAASIAGTSAGYVAAAAGAGTALTAAILLRHQLQAEPELAIATFCSLSLCLSPHVGGADLCLLAPSLALAGRRVPRLAVAAALVLSAAFLSDLSYVNPDTVPGFLGVAAAAAIGVVGLSLDHGWARQSRNSSPAGRRASAVVAP